ncbi:MAG: hypothetical protein OEV51_06745 [Nitrospira sp.]|nr:hypothetical protein [Nitrospira sp.]
MTWPQTKLRWWFACWLLISTFPCPPLPAAEPPPANPPPLNEKELFSYKPKGRGTATGQVFLSSPSGKAVTQAGVPVYLIPRIAYTRDWFNRNVRVSSCGSRGDAPSLDNPVAPISPFECLQGILSQFLTDKRLVPYLRTTRANPTGHFWFTKIPAGRYYVVSLLEGGSGAHQDERPGGIAWTILDLDVGEKATNLVVTDCRSGLC